MTRRTHFVRRTRFAHKSAAVTAAILRTEAQRRSGLLRRAAPRVRRVQIIESFTYHQPMFKLRRMRAMDPLQVAMTGVRMGERYLQLFCHDDTLTRGLATKTGLSGVAALAAPEHTQARRAEAAATKAGVLIDVKITPPTTLPWGDASFDMVVIDETGGGLTSLPELERAATLDAARRVLRPGGRVEIIERVGASLLGGGPATPADYVQGGGAEGLLRATGFNPVRTLAERDGFRFVEGLNPTIHLS